MALTVLDAGVVIGVIERTDAHHDAAHGAIQSALRAGRRLILPSAAYAEVLVKPSQAGDESVSVVDEFIDALPAIVEPITRPIAGAAARLRARHGRALRLPDALVIATAQALGAVEILTTDTGWPDVGVPVRVVRG